MNDNGVNMRFILNKLLPLVSKLYHFMSFPRAYQLYRRCNRSIYPKSTLLISYQVFPGNANLVEYIAGFPHVQNMVNEVLQNRFVDPRNQLQGPHAGNVQNMANNAMQNGFVNPRNVLQGPRAGEAALNRESRLIPFYLTPMLFNMLAIASLLLQVLKIDLYLRFQRPWHRQLP